MGKDNILVSVIIPTRNSARTLDKCLTSVKNQTYKNIEIIVVDNNSTDDTVKIAKKYTDKVYTKGPERSAQRNFGVKKSKGSYVLIIDSDMYLTGNVVSSCVEKVKQGAKSIIIPEKSFGVGFWAKVKAFERSFYVNNDLIEAPRFFEKKLFEKLGGFDEDITGFEDWDLGNRVRLSGIKIYRIKEFILHDEGQMDLFGSSAKKSYYSKWLNKYKQKYPKLAAKQLNPVHRFPLKKLLIQSFLHPILFSGMVIMKYMEWRNSKKRIML